MDSICQTKIVNIVNIVKFYVIKKNFNESKKENWKIMNSRITEIFKEFRDFQNSNGLIQYYAKII